MTAQIPEEEIERLKRTVDLAEFVRKGGVTIERHGNDLIGRCCFHRDRTPSLVVTPEKNRCHCLAACQESCDVIRWVMKSEGVSFRHAIELHRSGYTPVASAEPVKQSTVRRLSSPVDATTSEPALLGQVVRFYHETLRGEPKWTADSRTSAGISSLEGVDVHGVAVWSRDRTGHAGEVMAGDT